MAADDHDVTLDAIQSRHPRQNAPVDKTRAHEELQTRFVMTKDKAGERCNLQARAPLDRFIEERATDSAAAKSVHAHRLTSTVPR